MTLSGRSSSGVKHDIVFDSDVDDFDDIPIVSDDPPIPPQRSFPVLAPVEPIPFRTYRISWTTGTFGSSIQQIRFIGEGDIWIFNAEPQEVKGVPSYVITSPHQTEVLGWIETPKIPAYTLVFPNSVNDVDVLGLVWETAGLRLAFMPPGQQPYCAPSPDDRLAIRFRNGKTMPRNGLFFSSKPPGTDEKGKPTRQADLPIVAEASEKNFVIEDVHGIIVMKIYKMAEKFFTVQAVPYFIPPVVFAFAIAVIVK
jgi:hypothetical protein